LTADWHTYFDRLAPDSSLYRAQARAYVSALTTIVGVGDDQRVFDFGCGFGWVAATLAPLVSEVSFWDPSPNMRAVAEQNMAHLHNAMLLQPPLIEPGREPDGWDGDPFDLILVNSVAQYMGAGELWDWLPIWRSMLASGGRVVLSDLISPDHGGLSDIADLVRFGLRTHTTLRAGLDAVGGLRVYWTTNRRVPLRRVDVDELRYHATDAGFKVEVLPCNLTHFRKRWTALLRPGHNRTENE
jgi:cyclopropane fatty-acyl-phospholipid synthase-like methyltransferase